MTHSTLAQIATHSHARSLMARLFSARRALAARRKESRRREKLRRAHRDNRKARGGAG